MKRSYLAIAIFLSVALIGGATWLRFSQASEVNKNIELVTEATSTDEFSSAYSETYKAPPNNTASSEPLSQTDLISRQLFSEYAGIVSNGQATPSNLDAVAEKYAKNIVNLHQYSPISPKNLTTVENGNKNFQEYGDAVLAIRYKYMDLSADQIKTSGIVSLTDQNFPIFAKITGQLYEKAAEELLTVRTPISIANIHLDLVNTYLSSAQAMQILADPKDPMESYAALSALAENSDKEDDIYTAIIDALMKNGITYTQEPGAKNNI